jgi:hypothetical protein
MKRKEKSNAPIYGVYRGKREAKYVSRGLFTVFTRACEQAKCKVKSSDLQTRRRTCEDAK